MQPNFDRIARPYRWLEYFSFGPMLERCRFYRLSQLADSRRALVLGDGDGRFLARLLRKNSRILIDSVDLSPEMLQLLSGRVADASAQDRVTVHCANASDFIPAAAYDLVVTHFFLDCFTTDELRVLASRIRCCLTPDASWVLSEFATPSGPMSLPARFVVWALYAAFGIVTGLELRRLPDYSAALSGAGLLLSERRHWLGGLLVSELWKTPASTGLDSSSISVQRVN